MDASVNNEYGFTVSRDGLVAMVASDRGTLGESHIWISRRGSLAQSWPAPVRFTELDSSTDVGHAIVSDDGCEVFFASSAAGNLDLYVATWRPL